MPTLSGPRLGRSMRRDLISIKPTLSTLEISCCAAHLPASTVSRCKPAKSLAAAVADG